jgi:hypothetical protein
MGFLKNHLSSDDKQELLGLIEDYRQGMVPLIVPLTLLKHHLNRYPVPEWVHQQVYLHPYPKELMLRNHVQVQNSWRAQVREQLADILATLLQCCHKSRRKCGFAQRARW